jgi:hypothetical protein
MESHHTPLCCKKALSSDAMMARFKLIEICPVSTHSCRQANAPWARKISQIWERSKAVDGGSMKRIKPMCATKKICSPRVAKMANFNQHKMAFMGEILSFRTLSDEKMKKRNAQH